VVTSEDKAKMWAGAGLCNPRSSLVGGAETANCAGRRNRSSIMGIFGPCDTGD
jgi:hypothetical protein